MVLFYLVYSLFAKFLKVNDDFDDEIIILSIDIVAVCVSRLCNMLLNFTNLLDKIAIEMLISKLHFRHDQTDPAAATAPFLSKINNKLSLTPINCGIVSVTFKSRISYHCPVALCCT